MRSSVHTNRSKNSSRATSPTKARGLARAVLPLPYPLSQGPTWSPEQMLLTRILLLMGNTSERTPRNLLCRSGGPTTDQLIIHMYMYVYLHIYVYKRNQMRRKRGQLKLGFDVTLQIQCPKQLSACWSLFFLHVSCVF